MSTPHSQQPLSVPATQNTAPVIKFRCLYTHDVRRKAKRWQDGYLRFHTFNKRVMVYDTPGNFIGDLHWRQDSPLQDGDEMELDRGVLIQVCEPIEKTETDISAIYSNKKSQASPSRPGEHSTPALRPSTPVRSSISSQQPRSLNDLLGIKKSTPVGKLLSPYEQRNGLKDNWKDQSSVERPLKRPKLASSEERPREKNTRPRAQAPAVIDLSGPSTTTESANTVTSKPREEVSSINPRPAARAPSGAPSKNKPSGENTTSRTMEKPPHKPTPVLNPVSNPVSNLAPKVAPKPTPKPTSDPPPDPPSKSLRLSTAKPRKKLMYRGLLPGQASTPAPTHQRDTPQVVDLTESDPPPSAADYTPSASTMMILDEIADDTALTRPNPPKDRFNSMPPISASRQPNIPKPRAQIQHQPTTRPSTAGLRKAFSDPSALTSTRGLARPGTISKSPLNTTENDSTPREQGPWTSDALDLFSFWPPGRPKPV